MAVLWVVLAAHWGVLAYLPIFQSLPQEGGVRAEMGRVQSTWVPVSSVPPPAQTKPAPASAHRSRIPPPRARQTVSSVQRPPAVAAEPPSVISSLPLIDDWAPQEPVLAEISVPEPEPEPELELELELEPELVAFAGASPPTTATTKTPLPDSPAALAEAVVPHAAPQAPAVVPLPLPPSTRLQFDVRGHVKGFSYHATADLLWQTDGQHYRAEQKIRAFLFGSRAQESEGRVGVQGLQPERFVDLARKKRVVEFDFVAHTVHFSDGTTAPLTTGAQDRLSLFLQLGAELAAQPVPNTPGRQIRFLTVGPSRAEYWSFTVMGAEVLDLPAGAMPALKLQRLPRPGSAQTDELWLGTQLHYLPVRIRLTQANGDFADLMLKDHSPP